MAAGEARLALVFRAFFVLRFYLLPLLLRPSLHTLACSIICTCTGSLYVPAADACARSRCVCLQPLRLRAIARRRIMTWARGHEAAMAAAVCRVAGRVRGAVGHRAVGETGRR
jgi:hypothetical protein